MLHFLRWLKGYYLICISGYSPERFLNLCKINGIVLWNIKKNGQNEYLVTLSRSDYKKIPVFLEKTQVVVKIQRKSGLPFFLSDHRMRFPFLCGILGCVATLYFLSYFIWSFEIHGNKQIEPDVLIRLIQSQGVSYGSYKEHIDIETIEKKIREYFNNISWVSVRMEGTKLIVSLKEIENLKFHTNEDTHIQTNIYSDISGEILYIITRAGTPKVSVGDQVTKGQLLIEGAIPIYDDAGTLLYYNEVSADGDYTVRTTINISHDISRYYQYKHYTGKEQSLFYIRMGSHYFTPGFFLHPYEFYEIQETESCPAVCRKLDIPIFFGKRRYLEYTLKEDLYDESEARVMLNQYIENLIKELNEKGVQIVKKNVKIDVDNEKISLTGEFIIDVTREL